jgi:hypothetical protein
VGLIGLVTWLTMGFNVLAVVLPLDGLVLSGRAINSFISFFTEKNVGIYFMAIIYRNFEDYFYFEF